MTATIHALIPIAKLRCEGCGTLADAACGCGVGYMPVKASAAAAKAIAANPSASNRAIAAKVGIDESTVRKARGQLRESPAVEKRIGKDGKARKAPKAKAKAKAKAKPTIGKLATLPINHQVNKLTNEIDATCNRVEEWIEANLSALDDEGKASIIHFLHVNADKLLRLAQHVDGR